MSALAEIRKTTADMRRFFPNACGEWADQIDAALDIIRREAMVEAATIAREMFANSPWSGLYDAAGRQIARKIERDALARGDVA